MAPMSITPEKLARLRVFLEALPAEIAARLAEAVEADKQGDGGSGLPHDAILEVLRPRLAALNGIGRASSSGAELLFSEIDELARATNLVLREDRENLTEVVALLLERAPHEIAKALPAMARGSFVSTLVADFSHPVPKETVKNALRFARLMRFVRTNPGWVDLSGSLAGAERSVRSRLASYSDEVAREKRAANPSRAAEVEARVSAVLALTSILLGDAESNRLARPTT
jgi:hypothetical protein